LGGYGWFDYSKKKQERINSNNGLSFCFVFGSRKLGSKVVRLFKSTSSGKNPLPNQPLKTLYFCPMWGLESLSYAEAAKRVKAAGYDGMEIAAHYGYTNLGKMSITYRQNVDTINFLRDKYKLIQKRGEHFFLSDTIDFPEKPYYERLIQKQRQILFPINLGGPVQTMMTGTIGLSLLLLNKRWWKGKKTLSLSAWLVVFAALFWLRQSFNFVMATYSMLVRGHWSSRMDEVKIANYLHLWPATISLVTGLAGLGVLAFVALRVIPGSQRLTFLIGGLIGGSLGFWIWLSWIGPKLMP
jgi:hypothetical protein